MRNRLAALFLLPLLFSKTALSAEITSVLSSFDPSDPFDMRLDLGWEWRLRKAIIAREYVDLPTSTIRMANILNASRSSHLLNVTARFGLYRDFEAFLVFPMVLFDQTKLTFTSNQSRLDPAGIQPDLFAMPNTGPTRSGFGDMALGLRYGPFQQWRDPYYPSWIVGFKWTLPTGKVRRGQNSGVGNGYHEFTFETAASRRIDFIDPYFDLYGTLRVPASSTLFKDYGTTQGSVWPGHEIGIKFGLEFVPWEVNREDGKRRKYASLDLGGSAAYTFRGRGYTDLFDAIARSNCNVEGACVVEKGTGSKGSVTQYDRTLQNWLPGQDPKFMDGITDVDAFGTYSVWLGINVQPIEYLNFAFRFTYSRETAHYLTRAIVGKDLDGSGFVEASNKSAKNELNPVYNSSVDDPGRRIHSEGANIFGILFTLTGQY